MHFTSRILALVALVALWSCGGEPQKNDRSQSKPKEDVKLFRFAQSELPSSLDPIRASSKKNAWIVSQIYNNLYEFNEASTPVPSLVSTYKVNEDQTTYEFTLKEGVMFHDNEAFPDGKGRELTAEDVVYSFRRVLGDASLGSFIFTDRVLRDGDQISDTCFVAVSKYVLRINLQEPFYAIKEILAMPFAGIVPQEVVDKYGADFGRNPVGTGAFQLQSWTDDNLLLEKNPNYFKKNIEGVSYPFLDKVQVKLIPDQAQQLREFEAGNLDFISGMTSTDLIQKIKDLDKGKFSVIEKPYISTEYIGFQLDPAQYEDPNHPFMKKKVRQAMAYAVNREDIIFHFRSGLGEPAKGGFVPHGLPSHNPNSIKGYAYDPDKAQRLLKEAGYPNGEGFPEITLYVTTDYKSMGSEVAKMWKDMLNIDVKIEINEFQTHDEMVRNGKFKLFRGVWIGDFADEENFLAFFYSNNAPQPNKTRYKNEKFDKAFENITNTEGFERHDKFNAMENIVMEDCPVIVLYYDKIQRAVAKRVVGMDFNGLNTLNLEKIDIEPLNGGSDTENQEG